MSLFFGKNEFTFSWKIENVGFSIFENDIHFESPVFMAETLYGTSWYLEIRSAEGENNKEKLSCFLKRAEVGIKEICIGCKMEIIDKDGYCLQFKEFNSQTFKKGEISNECVINFIKIDCIYEECLTVRCHMVLQDSNYKLAYKCNSVTRFGVDKCSFQWNVPKHKFFSRHPMKEEKCFPCSTSVRFQVILISSLESMTVVIQREKKENQQSLYVVCKVSLLDSERIQKVTSSKRHLFNSDAESKYLTFPVFIVLQKLRSEQDNYLKNDELTFMFEFSISNKITSKHVENYRHHPVIPCRDIDTITVLQEDLRHLYTRSLHADISLQTEHQTFQAHKSLLSARSPVFATMFTHDMMENSTGNVDIPDVEAKILDCFLGFLYTGAVDNMDCDCAAKLLIVADKYQVVSLKSKCSSYLMSNLSVENVCDVALVADMVGHEELKASAVKYISSHTKTVLTSDGWLRTVQNNMKLATEIMCQLSIDVGNKIESGK